MSALFVFSAYCNRQEICFNELPPFPATGPEVFTWEQAGGEESRPSVCSARDSEGDPGPNSKLPNRPPGETHRHTDALTVCCELQHMLLANTSECHPCFPMSHSYKPALYCTFFLFIFFWNSCRWQRLKQEFPKTATWEYFSNLHSHAHSYHSDRDYCVSRLIFSTLLSWKCFFLAFALSFIGIMPPQAFMLKGCQMSSV